MKLTTKELVLISLFTSLTIIGAFISIPLGPIPVTLQTLFVTMGFLLLGGKLSFISQLVYILLGFIGLPIFSGFSSGLQAIFKPSFGFIIGFLVSSLISGYFLYRKPLNKLRLGFWAILGNLLIYLIGLPYMYYILNVHLAKGLDTYTILSLGLLPFIPGDIIKIGLALIISFRLIPVIKKERFN